MTNIVDVVAAPPVAAHPFGGLVLAEAAGLRMEPGSVRALFDQPTWDLTGLGRAPVIMGNHRKILDLAWNPDDDRGYADIGEAKPSRLR